MTRACTACARLPFRAEARTHDESRRAASSHVVIGTRELAVYIEAGLGPVRRPPRVLDEPFFTPAMGRMPWPVPPIDTVGDLAERFELDVGQLAHAAIHTGRRVVVRLDLEDFFAAVTAGHVYGIFRTAGYPEAVAHTLTGLCTNVVPVDESVPGHWRLSRRLAAPHLPQGAPTSPALANLAAFTLDRRLTALAADLGARYSRYADDLVLSADHHLRTPQTLIGAIAGDEGFRVHARKTRVLGRGSRQVVTGIVVNERLNVARAEYDLLKAILHNAARDGAGELDPAHVLGRIAWVSSLHPARGAKLRARFDAIRWSG